MTVTQEPTATTTGLPLELVAVDLYRDIHKGIRSELFAVTEEAGRVDPADRADRAALSAHVRSVADVLVKHAAHEDIHVQPAVEAHLPDLAAQVERDHERLEGWMADVTAMADDAVFATGTDQPVKMHRLYLELASFTSSYLAHQDLEERTIMPALDAALGFDACLAIHSAIVGSIPPEDMATSLAFMLPAMNINDRAELLGGMKANAPAEVFNGVWGLAGTVLTPRDHAALGARLGV